MHDDSPDSMPLRRVAILLGLIFVSSPAYAQNFGCMGYFGAITSAAAGLIVFGILACIRRPHFFLYLFGFVLFVLFLAVSAFFLWILVDCMGTFPGMTCLYVAMLLGTLGFFGLLTRNLLRTIPD